MKSLILSTSDFRGGAAKAAFRLHRGLQGLGTDSHMLVQEKLSDDDKVHSPVTRLSQSVANVRVAIDALPLKLYRQKDSTVFSPQWLPDSVGSKIKQIRPQVVNVHWTGQGFLRAETFARISQPTVLTLHDMWAFTGGCHYSQGCERYIESCGACPQLGSSNQYDLSRWLWKRKYNAWRKKEIVVVALSSWMKKCAESSSLFRNIRVELIPNGINTKVFKPVDKRLARKILGLPQDKKIALFGAVKAISDKRKGFHLLQPALKEIYQMGWHEELELAIFGASKPENPPDFGFPSHYLGSFGDELSLKIVYSAADVFILPSTQDNLPNTILEALACGIPCVAFKIGGLPDLIDHMSNGYLARFFETNDLAHGIDWLLKDPFRYKTLVEHAFQKVENNFNQEVQAHRYFSLFEDLVINQ